jgi:hypothetical protein
MKSVILFMLLTLATILPNISHGAELETPEQTIEAMESIIADFCQTKTLCDSKEHGQFTVFMFHESETAKLLSDTEKNTISFCNEKYEIRMTKQNVETLYIYCYDGKHPKLKIEKDITQDSKLR